MIAVTEAVAVAAVLGVAVAAFVVWVLVMNRLDERREERERDATRNYWGAP